MVIGKITSIGSLFIIGAIAILFLKQAHGSSFGSAGRDVGQGLTGISSGISNLFNSFINPITGLFGSLTSLFSFGQSEQSAQSQNDYGYIRAEPTAGTSSQGSTQAVQHTISSGGSSSGGANLSSLGNQRASGGGFGAAN